MLDQQDGEAQVGQVPQEPDEVAGLFGVESRGGLVEHEQRRGGAQGPGQLDDAQVAEGEVAGPSGQVAPEADEPGDPFGPLGPPEAGQSGFELVGPPGGLGHRAAEEQVVEHGEAGEEPGVLEGPPQPTPAPGHDRTPERLPLEGDFPPVGGVQARDAVEERRLARSVGADHPGHLTGTGDERDIVERLQTAEAERHARHGEDLLLADPQVDGPPAVRRHPGRQPVAYRPEPRKGGGMDAGRAHRARPSTRRQVRRPISASPPGTVSTVRRATAPAKNWS